MKYKIDIRKSIIVDAADLETKMAELGSDARKITPIIEEATESKHL